MIEKEIIKDQKETIHRLQKECMEKTDIIEKLNEENAELKERFKILDEEDFVYEVTEIEYNNFKKMKQALEEIREIASETGCLKFVEIVNKVIK